MNDAISWSDEVDDVVRGDLTAAVAYLTPAGGAVVTAVSPLGLGQRDLGTLGFTTSLAFGRKLERIIRDPRIAVAYHAREHGSATSQAFVLAQGTASVDLTPSTEQITEVMRRMEHYLGETKRGPLWDRLLREYHWERVVVDIAVQRLGVWPSLDASGAPTVTGPPWPGTPEPQSPPKNGTGPRVDMAKAAKRIAGLRHRLLAYQGADGLPVIVPVSVTGHDAQGLRLATAGGPLPPGGRRAGLLAHEYRAQCVGLGGQNYTGWLDVSGDTAYYAPHTSKGFTVPPSKTLMMLANGLMAKYGMRQVRRDGTIRQLEELVAHAVDPR